VFAHTHLVTRLCEKFRSPAFRRKNGFGHCEFSRRSLFRLKAGLRNFSHSLLTVVGMRENLTRTLVELLNFGIQQWL
jgi:hypothetical protein